MIISLQKPYKNRIK